MVGGLGSLVLCLDYENIDLTRQLPKWIKRTDQNIDLTTKDMVSSSLELIEPHFGFDISILW